MSYVFNLKQARVFNFSSSSPRLRIIIFLLILICSATFLFAGISSWAIKPSFHRFVFIILRLPYQDIPIAIPTAITPRMTPAHLVLPAFCSYPTQYVTRFSAKDVTNNIIKVQILEVIRIEKLLPYIKMSSFNFSENRSRGPSPNRGHAVAAAEAIPNQQSVEEWREEAKIDSSKQIKLVKLTHMRYRHKDLNKIEIFMKGLS
jgi:hypothetical protein